MVPLSAQINPTCSHCPFHLGLRTLPRTLPRGLLWLLLLVLVGGEHKGQAGEVSNGLKGTMAIPIGRVARDGPINWKMVNWSSRLSKSSRLRLVLIRAAAVLDFYRDLK